MRHCEYLNPRSKSSGDWGLNCPLFHLKKCATCGEVKAPENFYPCKGRKDSLQTSCKDCGRKHSRRWQADNRTPASTKNSMLKSKYNLTLDDYHNLLDQQGGKCACCGTTDPRGKGTFHVDHCHETGHIRGLLCHSCNVGIGHLGDNLQGILQAAMYLSKTS
jgi:hypothetical protein